MTLVLFPFSIIGLKKIIKHKYGFWFLSGYIAYLVFGITIAVVNDAPSLRAIYQLFFELKFILIFSFFMGLPHAGVFFQKMISLGKAVVLLSIPIIVLQMIYPVTYYLLFPNSGDTGGFLYAPGSYLPRASGVLWFPGENKTAY